MSTDTSNTSKFRDMNPNDIVTVSVNGTPGDGSKVEDFLAEHDAAIMAARVEGAKMLYQQMENVLYDMAADGALYQNAGISKDYADGVMEGAKIQLAAAKVALVANLVDFTQEINF